MNEKTRSHFVSEIATEYQEIRENQVQKTEILSLEEARKRKPNFF